MRQGDFSALCSTYDGNGVCADPKGTQLYNPWTGSAFVNNKIPSNPDHQAGPGAERLPARAHPGHQRGRSARMAASTISGWSPAAGTVNSMDLRIDYQISSKDQVYGVYTRNIGDPLQVVQSYPATLRAGQQLRLQDPSAIAWWKRTRSALTC